MTLWKDLVQLEYTFIIRSPPSVMISIKLGSCHCYSSFSMCETLLLNVVGPAWPERQRGAAPADLLKLR
jgi:hypothetical protein